MKSVCIFVKTVAIIIASIFFNLEEANAFNNKSNKEKVIIYRFKDRSNVNLYRYYSYIIPNSIKTELEKINLYRIETLSVSLAYIDESSSTEIFESYIRFLSKRGKELNANFIISGSYYVKEKNIYIKTQIFDVATQKITDIKECSDRIGAILQNIIDEITRKINYEMQRSSTQKAQKAKKRSKKRVARSPFLSFYNSIMGITFGLSYGLVDMLGKWEDEYKKGDMVTAYVFYELNNINLFQDNAIMRDVAISFHFDYFSTNTEESYYTYTEYSYLDVTGITLNFVYLYRLAAFFDLAFSAGMGVSESEFLVPLLNSLNDDNNDSDDSTFATPESYRETIDPYVNLTIFMNLTINHIQTIIGVSHKTILSDDRMSFSVIYMGIGYRI
ncbi:MAG: hypothetical protein SVZ03_00690 [Spirochaetota bacterium]|nr:hypothetical protein [Spirochaetota bacterium]